MDIKRVNANVPPQAAAPSDKEAQTGRVSSRNRFDTAAAQAGANSTSAEKAEETAGTGALLGAPCKRADLSSPKFNVLLQEAVDKLLERHAANHGPVPDGMRDQIANALASDPFFAKRVFHLLDQEAAQAEGR